MLLEDEDDDGEPIAWTARQKAFVLTMAIAGIFAGWLMFWGWLTERTIP